MVSASLAAAGFYIGLCVLLNTALMVVVIRRRAAMRIGVGLGGDKELERRVRVHGNFAENVPFVLVGLLALALIGFPVWLIHALGALTVLTRLAHAYGLWSYGGSSIGRTIGMVALFFIYVAMAAALIGRFLGLF